jgi:mannose-6-phosphate isomerase-like protein (cupin superfamily)
VLRAGDVLTNAASGERIQVLVTAAETDGAYLEWEDTWPAGHRRVAAHVHPEMEERWRVLEGQMQFEIDGKRLTAQVGDVVVAPAGSTHRGWNDGADPARLLVRMTPALRWADVIERLFALAEVGRTDSRGVPGRDDLVALLRDFPGELQPPPR